LVTIVLEFELAYGEICVHTLSASARDYLYQLWNRKSLRKEKISAHTYIINEKAITTQCDIRNLIIVLMLLQFRSQKAMEGMTSPRADLHGLALVSSPTSPFSPTLLAMLT
jgi:hypothetical protein